MKGLSLAAAGVLVFRGCVGFNDAATGMVKGLGLAGGGAPAVLAEGVAAYSRRPQPSEGHSQARWIIPLSQYPVGGSRREAPSYPF